jgi:hypothetical protein
MAVSDSCSIRPMTRTHLIPGCLILCLATACGGSATDRADATDCSTVTAENTDDCVRLNHLQVLGTHNSYHLAPDPPLLAALGERGRNLDYTHRPLTEQLSQLHIRQFELDVFADPDGGRYAEPSTLEGVPGLTPPGPAMREPGFKVLHVQDIDYRTTCETLVACLREIRDWSQANPSHVPIMILIEAKDSVPRSNGFRFVEPIPFGTGELHALDTAIRSVFDDEHLITPDRVRGRHATLEEAVRTDGWPRLGDSRGRILFALDNTGEHRTRYLQGSPSLEGRVMFVSSPAGEPSAAFMKMNEAMGEEAARIRQMVEAGYLVRTRADIPTEEARSGDTTRRDRAFASGAHYVSTDYPEESPFGSGYVARLPQAERLAARCNPVTAPAGCRAEWLEPRSGER